MDREKRLSFTLWIVPAGPFTLPINIFDNVIVSVDELNIVDLGFKIMYEAGEFFLYRL